MSELIIRQARPEDAARIAEFQIQMARETEQLELDPDTVARGVQAVYDDPAKGQYWVAERDGSLVGGLLLVPEWSDWRCGTVLWIHSVYVIPAARGQGIFRRLYEALKSRVEQSPELCGLRLFVDKTNTRAQKVYESMGMDGDHYRLYEWLK